MQSIQLRALVSAQGKVILDMPPELANQEVNLVVIFEPVSPAESASPGTRAANWPPGFWEEVAGSIPDFPEIEREGDFEVREPLA